MSANNQNSDDDARLAAIRLLDLEDARPAFERIARLAQAVAGVPVAHVAFVDADMIWRAGVAERDPGPIRRKDSFADWVIRSDKVLWIENTAEDLRFASNPFVTGESHFRFYAGAPIRLSTGETVGALSVVGRSERPFDAGLATHLKDMAGLVADEWERRLTLKALVQREAEATAANQVLAGLIEAAPVSLLMTDRNMVVVHASRTFRDSMAVSDEITGQCIYDLFPGSRERWGKKYDRCLGGETLEGAKVRLTLPNGERPWVRSHMTPWRDSQGAIGGLLIMSHDISDMVQSVDQLERSERRLRMAAELAKISIWEFDHERDEVHLEGHRLSGHKALLKDAVTSVWERIHPEDRGAAIAGWNVHLETGAPYRMDYRVKSRATGEWYWAAAASEAVHDDDGKLIRVVGVVRSIEQERQADAALEKALNEAENANRAKSEFLADMSHEIRTPLNGVLGVAGALAKTELTSAQSDMVQLIESSGQTLGRLLADILDLARIESGRLVLKDESFVLSDALLGAAALFEPDALAKGLRLNLHLGQGAEQTVVGDPTRLRQIVSNLLSNAIKFTDHGQITLGAAVTPAAEGLALTFSATDTGIGFDAETGARLFNRFEQADGSITRRAGGAGLGLAISRSLAEAMGGTLTAVSHPGAGSTFTLTLPLQKADAVIAAEPAATPEPAGRGLRVLLAEDHPTNRKVVELILGSIGVELMCVENGRDAVEAAALHDFDLILMDMQMPVMDGLTATRLIREREAATGAAAMPILCLTANAMPEHIEASRLAGANSHLTKPISAACLIAAVREAGAGKGQTSGVKKRA